jgi:hypothetical protein
VTRKLSLCVFRAPLHWSLRPTVNYTQIDYAVDRSIQPQNKNSRYRKFSLLFAITVATLQVITYFVASLHTIPHPPWKNHY